MRTVSRTARLQIIVFIVLAFNIHFSYASMEDENIVNSVFETHGKKNVVNFLLQKNDGKITIQKKKSFTSVKGRPDIELITAKSVVYDLSNLKIETGTLKSELDIFIENEAKKKQEKINSVRSISIDDGQGASLSKQLKYKMKLAQAKYNSSDSNSERRRLRQEISILNRAYKNAKKNEASTFRVYFPDSNSKTTEYKRNSSSCNRMKTQLQKLTGSVFRHQVFFCKDREYRAKNPQSCGNYRRTQNYSLKGYKSEISQLRSKIAKDCSS